MVKKPTKRKSKKKKKSTKKKRPSLLLIFSKWMLILGLWAAIFLSATILWFAKDLPDITQSAVFERRASIIIKSSNGKIISRYGESKGENISVNDLPVHLINAVLATEDRRFYSHIGIDPLGIARAMSVNIIKGRFVQGGSTITQQLAKNLFLSHDRKLSRKIQEALLAIWLERELSKDEILSAYMNRVYLGSGTYGFEAASLLYFDKHASEVNLREAAILAGLLKAPSKYSPHNNLSLAKERSDVVLSAMQDAGYLKISDISEDDMSISLPNKVTKSGGDLRYFTDWVIEGLDDLIGRPDMDLVIETSLDLGLQKHAQDQLINTIDNASEDQYVSQGAILALRPDGGVISMVGGYNYGQSQFNRSTQAKRSTGSAFKPFIYLTALEQGWKSRDKILDAPITTGEYRPKNFAGKYYGEVSLEKAMAKSMNTATLRLTKEIGISSVIKTARRLGITSKLERDYSISLGSSGISMLEMGTAYATLANGGYRIYPYAITRITDGKNNILFERKTPKYLQVVKSKHAQQISSMMETVINEGTGRRARLPFPASGKTGTSQNSRDAWFVGYNDKMVSIVWLGNDDNSPMENVTGGNLPAQIWREVMLFGNAQQSDFTFPKPHSQNNSGISGLLGRLLSSENHRPRGNSKGNYSNLNE